MRRAMFAAVVAIALAAGPATARDFCVGLPGCESASVQQALDAARSNPGRDRVLIGPGDWVGSATVGDDVEIEGSGPATTLTGVPALQVTGGTVGVRRLRLAGSVSAQAGTLSLRDLLIDARAPGDGPAVTTAASTGAPVRVVDLQSVTMLGH